MDNAFDTQALIDAMNQVKSVSNYNDVQIFGGYELCELPDYMKALFELYDVKYIRPFGLDIDKDTMYIVPKCKPKINDLEN